MDTERFEKEFEGWTPWRLGVAAAMVVVFVSVFVGLAKNYRDLDRRVEEKAALAAERAKLAEKVIAKRVPGELRAVFQTAENFTLAEVTSLEEGLVSYSGDFFDGEGVVAVSGELRGKALVLRVGREGYPPMAIKGSLLIGMKESMRERETGLKWSNRKFMWSPLEVNMLPAPGGKGYVPGYLSGFSWEAGA